MRLQVSGAEKDDSLGIIRKKVQIGSTSVVTPIKGTKYLNAVEYIREPKRINEITKQVKESTLNNFHEKEENSRDFVRKSKKYFLEDSFNVVITNFISPNLPTEELTKTLADVIYSASDKVICLPTVKNKTYQIEGVTSGGKPKFTVQEESFAKYLDFQKTIIAQIRNSNSKDILGIVPFGLPPKYMIKLVDMYFEKEIYSFVIDANTSNILNREPNLRSFLSHVGDKAKENGSSIADSYIHAINVGTSSFTADYVPADDFLNFFTYIDVVGTISKSRFAPNKNIQIGYPAEPKKKVFMRTKYSYDLADKLPDQEPYTEFKKHGSSAIVKKYNEKEQFMEAKKVNSLIGDIELTKYVHSKKGITEISWKKLENIFNKVKLGLL